MEVIKSKIEKYNFINFENSIKDIKKYDFAIIYKLDRVEVLKTQDITNLDDLLELRAFSNIGELKVINANGEFKGRERIDEIGEATEITDETHLLWGMPRETKNGYTYLIEDRGTKLNLPIEVGEGQRAFIKVRNYLSKDAFEFNDYRMVEFIVREAKMYGEKYL